MDDHSSDHAVTDAATAANPDLLEQKKLRRLAPKGTDSTRSLFGVAPGGACHAAAVASRAVGSYPTVSPLPADTPKQAMERQAVYFLWRFPSGCPARALPGTVSFWSPDFPPRRLPNKAAIQPSAQGCAYPADSTKVKSTSRCVQAACSHPHTMAPAQKAGTAGVLLQAMLHRPLAPCTPRYAPRI